MRLHGRHAGGIRVRHFLPEWQVVAIIISVITKTAMFDHQFARIRGIAPRVPTLRSGPRQFADNLHGFTHVFAFRCFIHVLVGNPAQAMAGDFMPQLLEGCHRFRIAFQGHRYAKHRQRQSPLLEHAQQAPQPGARTIFINRLHAQVARGKGGRTDHLR
ncbi:hypothetical protein D3C72_1247360 [compost metagenome]